MCPISFQGRRLTNRSFPSHIDPHVYYCVYIEGLFIPSASMGCMYAEARGYVLPTASHHAGALPRSFAHGQNPVAAVA